METDYVCKCNNCGNILIDENPQTGADKFQLTGSELRMEKFFLELNGSPADGYWGCPECCTDSFLTDIE